MPNTFVRFDQSFETDFDGFSDSTNGWEGTITIVPSGTGGVVSPDGSSHAVFTQTGDPGDETGPFTRFDGYRSLDDDQGFTTQVTIYLDPSMAAGEGFDYSVAANGQDGSHIQDFIFHVTADTSTGELLIGASNNTNFDPREDLELGNHGTILTAGWYTFEHVFAQDLSDGSLTVTMRVRDELGNVVFTQVLDDNNTDFATEFGGNRYGWFTNIDVSGGILVDNAVLLSEDNNPVQVFEGNTIIASFATIDDAKTAIDNGDVTGATLEIATTDQDDAFFYVVEGMSIQAAIDAADAGDLVLVADGAYNESLTIGKAITLEGVDVGDDGVPDVILTPTGSNGIEVSGDIDAGGAATVEISGFSVEGASSVGLRIASSTDLSNLVVTDSNFSNNGTHGIGSGSGAFDLDAISITNSTFTDNGQGGANGSGDIVLFGFHGDATLSDLTITSTATEATAVSARGDTAIQISGFDPSTYDVDTPIGNVVVNNVTVDGWYHKPQFVVQGFTDLNGLSFTGVELSGGTSWGDLLFIDPIGSTGADAPGSAGYPGNYLLTGGANSLDLSGVTINSDSTDVLGVDSRVRGTDGDDNITGTNGNDLLNDFAEGGVDYGGNDNVSGMGGDDVLVGGLGDDTLDGGSGEDVGVYAGVRSDFTLSATTDANGFITGVTGVTDNNVGDGDEGTDVLTSVETLSFAGGAVVLNFTQAVQLFDGSDELIGTFDTIKEAVDAASDGFTIRLAAGVYDDDDEQIVIDKDLTIIGAGKDLTTVEAAFDTGTSGDSRGWFLVTEGTSLDVSGITFDGAGHNIWQAFRHLGSGEFDSVAFTDIEYQETGSPYQGTAIAVFGSVSDVDVTNSMFSDIGRIGVLYFGAGVTGDFTNNVYQGKGVGDFLDYALDISAGATINVVGNTVTNNRGVAASDGSQSAAFLVTTFFGGGTNATFENNMLSGNTTGVFVGFNSSDTSNVEFLAGNTITGGTGVQAFGNSVLTGTDLVNGNFNWVAGDGDNALSGSLLGDTLVGGDGNDTLVGGAGADSLEGGANDDVILGGAGADFIDGGDGTDTVSYATSATGVTIELGAGVGSGGDAAGDTIANVENIIGSAFDDVLIGNADSNDISGEGGADLVSGSVGNDTLSGGAGDDTLNGGAGDDTIGGESGRDFIAGGDGNDTLHGFGSHDTLGGGAGNDDLRGGFGRDLLNGSSGNDVLRGFEGDDRLFGGGGADTLLGNDGNDSLTGGGGVDRLKGDDGDDTLNGRFGDDLVSGGAGDDLFEFRQGHGNDTYDDFVAGAGTDDAIELISFGTDFDTFAEVIAAASDNGTDTTIDFGGGDSILLLNVTVADLHEDDFLFS